METCLTMKVKGARKTIRGPFSALTGEAPGLFGMALGQTTGFVESLLRLVGLDWIAPDFSTQSRCQKTLAVIIPYHGSSGSLHLLIPPRDITS